MHNKIVFILLIIGIVIVISLIPIKHISQKSLKEIQLIEQEQLVQFTNDGILKDSSDREKYLDQIEEYLSSHKTKLFISQIYRNENSITIRLYSGVHYTIYPKVKGAK